MANTGNIKYSGNSRGGLDFEAHLWPAADKMRGPMDASESSTLDALRDALLPKLLSGELRVPAAAQAANKKSLQ
jgi:hypothetical protein